MQNLIDIVTTSFTTPIPIWAVYIWIGICYLQNHVNKKLRQLDREMHAADVEFLKLIAAIEDARKKQ
jgi:hypothetical protein